MLQQYYMKNTFFELSIIAMWRDWQLVREGNLVVLLRAENLPVRSGWSSLIQPGASLRVKITNSPLGTTAGIILKYILSMRR